MSTSDFIDFDLVDSGDPKSSNFLTSVMKHVVGVKTTGGVKVPDGYQVRYDAKTGRSYLMKQFLDYNNHTESSSVENEHLRDAAGIGFCQATRTKLGDTFGTGIFLYFDYLVYLIVVNFILFLVMGVNIGYHLYVDGFNVELLYKNFFVSTYSAQNHFVWMVTLFVCAVGIFATGPILSLRITSKFKRLKYSDHEDDFDPNEMDVIRGKSGQPANNKGKEIPRFVLSYVIFFLCLLLSTGITTVLVTLQMNFVAAVEFPNITRDAILTQEELNSVILSTNYSPIIWTIIIVLSLSIINWAFEKILKLLTNLEGHYTWTAHKKHHSLKFFVWKILNVSTVFFVRWLVQTQFDFITSIISEYGEYANTQTLLNGICGISHDADQFTFTIILDITIIKFASTTYNWFSYWAYSSCKPHKTGGKFETGRPNFDIAEQYLELIYRQYIIYLGMPVFPAMPLLGLIGNIIEYQLDKMALLNLSRTPPYLGGSMRSFVVSYMFSIAVLTMFMFPQGWFWVMIGFSYQPEVCPYTIFDNGNVTVFI